MCGSARTTRPCYGNCSRPASRRTWAFSPTTSRSSRSCSARAPSPARCLSASTPTRREEALARDVRLADCRLVLAERRYAHLLAGLDLGDTRLSEPDGLHTPPAPLEAVPAGPDDLLMPIFTSGTSGDPKAVRCTRGKIAFPGRMLAGHFALSGADTIYVSMPMVHSNAIMTAGRSGSRRARRSRYGAGSPRRVSCPMSRAPPTPTTSASHCPMCSQRRRDRTTRTTRCASSTETKAPKPTSRHDRALRRRRVLAHPAPGVTHHSSRRSDPPLILSGSRRRGHSAPVSPPEWAAGGGGRYQAAPVAGRARYARWPRRRPRARPSRGPG